MAVHGNIFQRAARSALGALGYRLVRLPRGRGRGDAGPGGMFFPHGKAGSGPWKFPGDWDAPDRDWLGVLRELYADPASFPASISPQGGSFLYWLVRNIRPRQVMEIGTCLGASTIWMGAAMKAGGALRRGGALHTFDDFTLPINPRLAGAAIFQDRRASVETRIRRAGLGELVRFHVGDSKRQAPEAHQALRDGGNVQLAFIDGDHSPEGVIGDLLVVEPVLQPGGYVVLHDVYPGVCGHTGPRALLDQLARVTEVRYRFCEIYTAPRNYGLAVMQRQA